MFNAAADVDDKRPDGMQSRVARHGRSQHGGEFGVKRRCEKGMGGLMVRMRREGE